MFKFPSNNEFLQELRKTIALLQTPKIGKDKIKMQLVLMQKLYKSELGRKIRLAQEIEKLEQKISDKNNKTEKITKKIVFLDEKLQNILTKLRKK